MKRVELDGDVIVLRVLDEKDSRSLTFRDRVFVRVRSSRFNGDGSVGRHWEELQGCIPEYKERFGGLPPTRASHSQGGP